MSAPTTLRSVLLTLNYIPVPCHPTIQADPSEVHELEQCHLELEQCLRAYNRVCHSTQAKREQFEWINYMLHMYITLYVAVLLHHMY